MQKYRMVFWNRPFIKYMREKSYSHFGVSKDYIKQSWTGPDAFKKFNESDKLFFKENPEIRHLWQDWRKERKILHMSGFDTGPVLNRKTNEQYTFNTSVKHLPWIEYKHYSEVDNLDVTDCLIDSAQRLADKGKTIDFFWSGGLDSTAALIALNEVCPKQLHVIIGESTEYPDYYDKVVRHLDHTINKENDVFKEASPDKNLWCACGEADQMFGAMGFGKSRLKYEDTPEKVYLAWERRREYKWSSSSFRFLMEWGGDKMDMDNYAPIFCQPTLEKWSINEHMKGLKEGKIFPTYDPINPTDELYKKCKMPLRDHIYKFTKDKEYSYDKGKEVSLLRGQVLKNRVDYEHEYRVWGILDDGTMLTKDNIEQFNWRGFLHHYKEEWN